MTALRPALAACLAAAVALPALAVQRALPAKPAPASSPSAPSPMASTSPIAAPAFKSGSTWTFHIAGQRDGKVWGTDGQWTLLQPDARGDWSFARGAPSSTPATAVAGTTATNWNGRDATPDAPAQPDQPLSFPLAPGKQWQAIYDTPAGTHWSHVENRYDAIVWEDITVAAGKFRALRIEMAGASWDIPQPAADAASSPAARPGGAPQTIVRSVSWYVPAVQNFVRQEAEFGPPDAKTPDLVTFELTRFSLAK